MEDAVDPRSRNVRTGRRTIHELRAKMGIVGEAGRMGLGTKVISIHLGHAEH